MRLYRKSIALVVFLAIIFLMSVITEGKNNTGSRMVIPIRVFSKGIRIKNFSIKDLTIMENSQVLTVTALNTVRKKMGEVNLQSRLFVLLLQVNNHNKKLRNILEIIFKNIITEKDQLIILVNDKPLFFQNLSGKDETLKKLSQVIGMQSKNIRMNMEIDLKKLEAFISYLRKDTQRTAGNDQATRERGKIHQHYYMKYFKSYLERYLNMIRDYNQQYLMPRLEKYYFIFNQIKKLKKETWVIHIQQRAKLPALSKKNRAIINKMITDLSKRDMVEAWYDEIDYAKKISKIKGHIDETLRVTTSFPTEEIINLIYKINGTLFSIFLEPAAETSGKNPESEIVYTDLKNLWKKIAEGTGGKFCYSVYPENCLEKISNEEDIVFLVSFISKNPQSPGKIRINPVNKNFTLFYDSNPLPGYFNDYLNKKGIKTLKIEIEKFHFKQKKISLVITHFKMKKIENQISGRIHVHILVKNKKNQIEFDENKNLLARKKIVMISINLNRLKKGDHNVTAEITDLISGDTGIETFPIKAN